MWDDDVQRGAKQGSSDGTLQATLNRPSESWVNKRLSQCTKLQGPSPVRFIFQRGSIVLINITKRSNSTKYTITWHIGGAFCIQTIGSLLRKELWTCRDLLSLNASVTWGTPQIFKGDADFFNHSIPLCQSPITRGTLYLLPYIYIYKHIYKQHICIYIHK